MYKCATITLRLKLISYGKDLEVLSIKILKNKLLNRLSTDINFKIVIPENVSLVIVLVK